MSSVLTGDDFYFYDLEIDTDEIPTPNLREHDPIADYDTELAFVKWTQEREDYLKKHKVEFTVSNIYQVNRVPQDLIIDNENYGKKQIVATKSQIYSHNFLWEENNQLKI